MKCTIVIPGEPISKMRPRFRGKFCYDPQHEQKVTTKYFLRYKLNEALGNLDNLYCSDYFELQCTYYLPIPQSLNQDQKNAVLWGFHLHITKPDVDNLDKWVFDCLNGIAYQDDRQIIKHTSQKKYSINPRTEITIIGKHFMKLKRHSSITKFSPAELKEFVRDCQELNKIGKLSLDDVEKIEKEDFEYSAKILFDFSCRWVNKLSQIKRLKEDP